MAAVPASCPHRPPCPGCPRWGEAGLAPEALRALAALAAEHGIAPPRVVEGPLLGWRHRARLMVRGRAASPKVGLFQAGTHRIADVPRCSVHHPRVNEVAAALRRALRATGTPPYADAPHRGRLRAVQVVVERASGTAQVVLVANDADPASLAPLCDALRAELGSALHSLWWNGNPERTNVILGPLWRHVCGPDMVEERLGGARVFFPPGAFGQANLPLADRLAGEVAAAVPDGVSLVEFHAGCGAFGLAALPRAARAVLNERAPAALAGLARGLSVLPGGLRGRAALVPGEAGAHAALVAGADAVIVDPPRKGLEPALLAALCATPPARLVAVSCALPAFLREARALAAAGLRLRALSAWALFPMTAHVETCAVFERGNGRPRAPAGRPR
jgi:tRNA/tmRNA/rRNA uracil-C5-methylase (TrmA/RlmC/RlmD family)